MRRVVVTGAAGSIGSLIVARCAPRWQLTAADIRAAAGVHPLDVTDLDACRRAFTEADAVVHLAADPDPGASWAALRGPNVEAAHAVAAAARETGVSRLVLASSLQAVAAMPDDTVRRSGDPPRPANLYGATKAWAEALGSWVAATSDTSVVALRIGYFPGGPPPAGTTARDRAAWLSPDDCVRLIVAAVEAEVTGFTVVNGTSANGDPIAELGAAERAIGYAPRDDVDASGLSRNREPTTYPGDARG